MRTSRNKYFYSLIVQGKRGFLDMPETSAKNKKYFENWERHECIVFNYKKAPYKQNKRKGRRR